MQILITRCDRIGVSKKISGVERTRLKVIAKTLQPQGFGLTVRTVAAGHSLEELQNDLEGLLSTWKSVVEHAKSAALAADEGVEGAVPIILHRAMGQTLSVVQDYFNEKVILCALFMIMILEFYFYFLSCFFLSIVFTSFLKSLKSSTQLHACSFFLIVLFTVTNLQVERMVVDSARTYHEVLHIY